MLAKKYKLPIQLFPAKRGKLLKNAYFSIKIFPTVNKFSRFGVTVSSKTASRAVKRNTLKRSVFNFAQGQLERLPVADYWVTILPPAVGLSEKDLSAELEALLATGR